MPKIFTGDDNAWKKMLETNGLQSVIIATPAQLHKEMIITTIEADIKSVATEHI